MGETPPDTGDGADAGADGDLPPATDAIVDALAARGCAVAPQWVGASLVAVLRDRLLALDAAGELVPAAVGRGAARSVRPDVRGDRLRWIDPAATVPAERAALAALEALRLACNRALQLGLFDVEAHYALYPPGAGYARHVDRFRDDDARVLSFVLYVNRDWVADDGGALVLEPPGRDRVEVAPMGGTLVAFLADRVPHEVRPARRERLSLVGWFRRRI